MRRMFWMGIGVIAGASGSLWAERKVRNRLEALQPDHLVVAAGNRAREVGRTVADAVADGRDAMRQREAELRGRIGTGPAPTGSATGQGTPGLRVTGPTRPRSVDWSSSRRHR
jgi:hypothetical protein